MKFEKPGQPVWWSLVMVLISMIALTIAGVGYTRYVDEARNQAEREADRRWCTLLVLLDNNNQIHPPTTDSGREYALVIHGLRVSLGCDQGDVNPIPTMTPTR